MIKMICDCCNQEIDKDNSFVRFKIIIKYVSGEFVEEDSNDFCLYCHDKIKEAIKNVIENKGKE